MNAFAPLLLARASVSFLLILLEQVNPDWLGRGTAEIIREASRGAGESAGAYENHVASLNTSDNRRRRKGNRTRATAGPGIGGTERRKRGTDKHRGIWKDAVTEIAL